ncbi:phosphoethanolamine transferase [Rhizobium sp. SGZ-381]|uniref:phosphoethanolamine transferase n=1 Tax=Rhizobium sp. SGZ-381 TaxID=3342800 RepID=UPI003672BB39
MKLEALLARRPRIGSVTLAIVTALYVLFALNQSFWGKTFTYLSGQNLALACLMVGLSGGYVALFVTVSVKYLMKPVLILFILTAAATAWFMDQFGVIVDLDMIRNAAETSMPEANHLITAGFVVHMVLYGLLPSALVAWARIRHRNFPRKFAYNMAIIVPCLALLLGAGLAQAGIFAFATRQHRDWFDTLNPIFPMVSAGRYLAGSAKERDIVAQPIGTDAKVRDAATASNRKPRVTIVVVGETARADSFQLGGYARATNPELSKRDILYFTDTSSCGTATAVSVPCMFSGLGRGSYSHGKGLARENLMDVLVHAGIRTEWWDNNTGSKGMAERIPYKELYRSDDPRFCENGECKDAILLDQLNAWLNSVTGDSVLVLHQLGSHGPAYYARYPDEYRLFTPDCRSSEFSKCHRDDIVNAYDNSIAYTDHILASVIDMLNAQQGRISPSMIYMSDHGESLGEKGLFLHGAPWVVAPAQQTHIPFVLWLGEEAKRRTNPACWAKQVSLPQSHDNLFHTVLGMMQVDTEVRNPKLDLMSVCQAANS